MRPKSLTIILCCTLISWTGSSLCAMETSEAGVLSEGNKSAERARVRAAYIEAGYEPSSINMGAVMSEDKKEADEIVLSDGDVIRGRIIEENANEVVLMHPVFEQLRIPRDKILAVKRSSPRPPRPGFGEVVTGAGVRPQTSNRQVPLKQQKPEIKPTTEETDPEGTEFNKGIEALIDSDHWDFVVGAAFGFVENVNSEFNIRLSAQAEHNSEFARLRINGAYFLNSANNEIIDNDVSFATTQDWFFPESDWSIFARGSYQWDEFELWEHRVSGYVGPGYKLINTSILTVDTRVGGGLSYEYGIPQTLPELLASVEWSWQINDRQKFAGTFSYAPEVTNFDQFRLSLNAEWNFQLQESKGLSFYIGTRNEFQSIVPEGSTKNDLRLFGGIKYDF
jgi:putative salt-induced outer membrane protein YdiY